MTTAIVGLSRLAPALVVSFVGTGAAASGEDSFRSMQFQVQQITPMGKIGPLVVNGLKVPAGVYDEVVRINFQESRGSDVATCTGVLLHNQGAVLTAGHCSCGVLESYSFVTKGDFERFALDLDNVTMHPIREPVRFPGYICSPVANNAGRDLALFFVQTPDQAKDADTRPRKDGPLTRLASMGAVYAAQARQLVVAGYGYTEARKLPSALMRAAVGVDSYFCSTGAAFEGTPCAGFREFVLSSPGGSGPPTDACGGDSGGPVYWYPPPKGAGDHNTSVPLEALVGITSRGLAFARNLPDLPCGGGGIYTAVGRSDVLNWLSSFGVSVRTTDMPDVQP
ncbi:trypsin-like serine protease [Mesorhizobium australicum]|uniref:trypsin-like serine protease n=1 Tax=Mesorhizobium australicum TaxID=536018 RepID=UPI00333CE0E2